MSTLLPESLVCGIFFVYTREGWRKIRTKVQKWGNSLAIRIPKGFADQLGVEHDREVDLVLEGDRLIVKLASERYSLSDLLAQVSEDNIPNEVSTGAPQGREAW